MFDGIHLLMNAGYPLAVNSSAGRVHKERVDTPESVVVIAEYPEDFLAVFTINYAAMHYKPRNDQMNQLDGDQARLDIGREDFKVYRQGNEEQPEVAQHSELGFGHATDLHVANFLECVKTRQTPTAPMRLGFQAALVIQMANMALKQGRRLRWNAQTNKVEALMKRAWFLAAAILLGVAAWLCRGRRAHIWRCAREWSCSGAAINGVRCASIIRFDPAKSALIVCDMWDKHWCSGANVRVAALVKKLEPVLETARRKGMIIVHAPSETMSFYANAPQRQRMLSLPAFTPPKGKEHHLARLAYRRFRWRLRHAGRERASGMDLRTSGFENCAGRLHFGQWAGNLQSIALARHRDGVLHRRPRQYVHSESHVRHKANDEVGRATVFCCGT